MAEFNRAEYIAEKVEKYRRVGILAHQIVPLHFQS